MAAVLLRKIETRLNVRQGEWRPLLLAFAYFFFLLAGYYILRPVREQFGIANRVENLQYLYTGTFVTMLAIIPIFGKLSSRFARVPLITGSYVFFALNIFLMYALHRAGVDELWLGRVYFVWVSVYNLFVVSVFWSFMVDVFETDQTKRLFGMIAAGGSLGALAGAVFTARVVTHIGTMNLLPIAGALLLCTLFFVRALARWRGGAGEGGAHGQEVPLGGGIFDGLVLLARSRYLTGVAIVQLTYVMTNTFLYFQQAHLVDAADLTADEQTELFSLINFAVSGLTLGIQFFVTGPLVARFGLAVVVVIMPLVALGGLVALALAPTLAVLVVVQVLHRGGHFSLTKPCQDMMFAVTGREAKYKTKNAIDTAVYRGGDFVTSWLYSMLYRLVGGLSVMAMIGAALATLWVASSWWVGRRFDRLAAKEGSVRGSDPEKVTDHAGDVARS